MKILNVFTVLILIIVGYGIAIAKDETSGLDRVLVNTLSNQVQEIRRDQLNYKLEKELLATTYQVNYERVNLSLAIVLAIFGALTFLGYRDINALKKEYAKELEELKRLRAMFELKTGELEKQKNEQIQNLENLSRNNDEQNKKIKMLEVKEKIDTLIKNENYTQALDYLAVALEVTPQDVHLLRAKAYVYTHLQLYADAIITYKELIKLETDIAGLVVNLAELCLLAKEFKEYNELIAKYKDLIETEYKKELGIYFESFKLYQNGDLNALRNYVKSILASRHSLERGLSWDFTDLRVYLRTRPKDKSRNLFTGFINYLNAKIPDGEMDKVLLRLEDNYFEDEYDESPVYLN